MGKRRVLSGEAVVRLLGEHGFARIRQRGSHVAMQRQHQGATVTVIVPMHREIRSGTLASIVRQSGLPRSLFLE